MDFRNILITILAASVTAFIMIAFVLKEAEPKVAPGASYEDISKWYQAFLGAMGSIKQTGSRISSQSPFFFDFEISSIEKFVETMDNLLEEAQALRDDEERSILIEKVSLYNNALDLALKTIWDSEGVNKEHLLLMSRITARHLALWNPFFYYVHPEAQAKIFPLTRKLEEEHNKLLRGLADADGRYAGEVATEDLGLYIKDIGRSAQRRNSDFIRFSYEDYLRYREFFDELLRGYPDFAFGFASGAYMLFGDFYAMNEKIGLDYSDETRGYIQDMRIELRDLHKRAILQFRESDEESALKSLEKTLSAIASEFEVRLPSTGRREEEIRDIIGDDYNFYNEIKNQWDN